MLAPVSLTPSNHRNTRTPTVSASPGDRIPCCPLAPHPAQSPTLKKPDLPQTHRRLWPGLLASHALRCFGETAPSVRDCRIGTPLVPLSLRRTLSYRQLRVPKCFLIPQYSLIATQSRTGERTVRMSRTGFC